MNEDVFPIAVKVVFFPLDGNVVDMDPLKKKKQTPHESMLVYSEGTSILTGGVKQLVISFLS